MRAGRGSATSAAVNTPDPRIFFVRGAGALAAAAPWPQAAIEAVTLGPADPLSRLLQALNRLLL